MPECSGAPNASKPPRLIFAVDHGFMGKGAAGAAVFLRDGGAKQTRRAGLGPDLARIEVVFVPFLDMRVNSSATKRLVCSSSSRTSSVIQAGRGRLRSVMGISPSSGHQRSMTTPPRIGNEQVLEHCKPSTPNVRIVERSCVLLIATRA